MKPNVKSVKKAGFDTFIDEKYLPLDEKKRLYIFAAIFCVPALLFYFLLFSPKQEDISNLKKRVNIAQQELQTVKTAAQDLPKYQKALEEINSEFEATSILLPTSQEIPNLLRNISDLGRSSGLDFLVFAPGAEIPQDFYAEIPINITMRGSFHSIGSFLDKISKLERVVTVNNITMDKPTTEGTETILNSNCRLITYRFTNKQLVNEDGKKK